MFFIVIKGTKIPYGVRLIRSGLVVKLPQAMCEPYARFHQHFHLIQVPAFGRMYKIVYVSPALGCSMDSQSSLAMTPIPTSIHSNISYT